MGSRFGGGLGASGSWGERETIWITNTACPRALELAERASNGTEVRLLWRQGTRQLWVEVREPDERVLAIPVRPERALDAFHHPYAHAGTRVDSYRPSRS